MSVQIGSAHLDVTASTAKALAALKTFGTQAASVLKPLTNVDLKVTTTIQKPKAADVCAVLAGVTGSIKVDVALKPLTQKTLNTALNAVKSVKITIDSQDAATRIANIRTTLNSLGTTVRNLFHINTTSLNVMLTAGNAMLTRFAMVITDLRALITQLNASGGRPNAPPGGAGSSSRVSSYSAQLKLLQADLKSGAINSTHYQGPEGQHRRGDHLAPQPRCADPRRAEEAQRAAHQQRPDRRSPQGPRDWPGRQRGAAVP